jgi:hypothetical protein
VIRTGSGEANGVLVTTRGVRNRDGNIGVLPPGLRFVSGTIAGEDGLVIDTPEEADVFKVCGLPWVSPWLRSADYYQRAAKVTQGKALRGQPMIGDVHPVRDWRLVRAPDGSWRQLDPAYLLAHDARLAAEVESLVGAGEMVMEARLF